MKLPGFSLLLAGARITISFLFWFWQEVIEGLFDWNLF